MARCFCFDARLSVAARVDCSTQAAGCYFFDFFFLAFFAFFAFFAFLAIAKASQVSVKENSYIEVRRAEGQPRRSLVSNPN